VTWPPVRRGLFVALEGLGGVGKSTVAPLLAAELVAVLMPSIPDLFQQLRRCFTVERQVDARYLYFLSALCWTAGEIEQAVTEGSTVVVESYFARATAFHRAMGSGLMVVVPESLIRPDVSFHLVCDEGVRQERLARRPRHHGLWDRLAENASSAILHEYWAFPMHRIDTTMSDPLEVVRNILLHPLDGGCDCADTEPLAGHSNLLSPVR